MKNEEKKQIQEYEGGCLCDNTTFIARGEPSNPHLCSCTICRKSSGAPTIAWVEFPSKNFEWTKSQPSLYRSSERAQRYFCKQCGSLLGVIAEGYENIIITIASLKDPNVIVPNENHSYKESAPSWWGVHIKR
ncbi:GFA family protein [Wolbachia endosymbiont of Ctenocephalides felis wCfeJ]|uniref:GFA family protein n=1 Tax=Wolbachia endosymbiont of Ctenocephalides felis wCfeJ TaxID=2732594 RepID=UPI001444CE93|nr:GFA family protein [Wolbachia endosymbiont of Ctenocephalides felis wCfeJ]WCR58509.1 MAG: hypothetical protein PG980_000981 [Wolbachia endosymbiont of Ctenocephalides felis wCfeJ]